MPGPKPRQPSSCEAVAAAYKSGKTLKQVQREFAISRATLLEILAAYSVPLHDVGKVHRDAQFKYMSEHPERFRADNRKMVAKSVSSRKRQYTVRITTAISPEMHDELRKAAGDTGEDLTEFVREAINRRLRSWRQNRRS